MIASDSIDIFMKKTFVGFKRKRIRDLLLHRYVACKHLIPWFVQFHNFKKWLNNDSFRQKCDQSYQKVFPNPNYSQKIHVVIILWWKSSTNHFFDQNWLFKLILEIEYFIKVFILGNWWQRWLKVSIELYE